jgi:hemerythrin superfamily protein
MSRDAPLPIPDFNHLPVPALHRRADPEPDGELTPVEPRPIAEQSLAQLGGRTSILARQRADHARLDRLMARARATEHADPRAHAVALRAVARLVFTHAFAEEAVLFPAARRALPEGDPLTLEIETDHQEVDELTVRLDRSSPDDPGHAELLRRTFAVLDHDVRTEEDVLLPRLQQVLGPRRLRRLGWRWELVRRISPTRPHPVVSRRPPGQTLSALPLTVLDRSRDRLQQLDELTRWRATRAISAADRWLSSAAGAVERVPLLRRGERAETSR